jgi:hypothetical protein
MGEGRAASPTDRPCLAHCPLCIGRTLCPHILIEAKESLGGCDCLAVVHSANFANALPAFIGALDIPCRSYASMGNCDGLPALYPNIVTIANPLCRGLDDFSASPSNVRSLSDMLGNSVVNCC